MTTSQHPATGESSLDFVVVVSEILPVCVIESRMVADRVAAGRGDLFAGVLEVAAIRADLADRLISLVDPDGDEESGVCPISVEDVDVGDGRSVAATGHGLGVFSGDDDVCGVAGILDLDHLVSPEKGVVDSYYLVARPVGWLIPRIIEVISDDLWDIIGE